MTFLHRCAMEVDDEVVEELDVYFCNKEDLGAQVKRILPSIGD